MEDKDYIDDDEFEPRDDEGEFDPELQEDDEYSQPPEEENSGDFGTSEITTEDHFSELNHEIEPIGDEDIEIENETSQVASAPAKNVLVLGALIVGAVIFLYNIVFKDDAEVAKQKETQEIIASQPVERAVEATQQEEEIQVDIGVVETPDLPDIEGLPALPPPSTFEEPESGFGESTFGGFEPEPEAEPEPEVVQQPEPAPIEPVAQPVIEPADITTPTEIVVVGPSEAEIAARKAARRKSGMIILNGGGPETDDVISETKASISPEKLSRTAAAQVTATVIGNTDVMIAQGKMIDAVLETAINTDLPGSLRAVISRDVYAETGKNVLIPKGSRLIGSYDNSVEHGQLRVVVTWSRLIRPDGVDVAIDSPGTDQLGRAGMAGIVDNKLFDIITNSILISAITIGGAIAIDGIEKSQGTSSATTTGSDGSSTSSTTGTPTDFAVLESIDDLSDVAQNVTEDLLNDQPTILVNQGARIKVFVNRDLVFPSSVASSINFVN